MSRFGWIGSYISPQINSRLPVQYVVQVHPIHSMYEFDRRPPVTVPIGRVALMILAAFAAAFVGVWSVRS